MFYEYIRIMLYITSGFLLLFTSVIESRMRLLYWAICTHFFILASLMIFRVVLATEVHDLANLISTPSMGVVISAIILNLWKIRKM